MINTRSKESKAVNEPSRVSLGIPFWRECGQVLGLTGDNSPKKRIIEHLSYTTYTIPFFASLILALRDMELSLIYSILFAFISILLQKQSNVFFLFKIYSEGGAGFNFYLSGWRIIGLDYHAWQIRQDPVTGKPLHPDEQVWSKPRPHIDIPNWNLHHWPWEQFEDHDTLQEKMKITATAKAEKLAKKLAKKQRRKEQLEDKLKKQNVVDQTVTTTQDVKDTEVTEEIQMESLFS